MNVITPMEATSWNAKEVVKEVNRKPHLLVRLEVHGSYFPSRAAPPFVRIVPDEGNPVDAWFTEETPDNRSLVGYFPVDLPQAGRIEFGYGDAVVGRVRAALDAGKIPRLDRNRIPGAVPFTHDILRKHQAAAGAGRPEPEPAPRTLRKDAKHEAKRDTKKPR